MDSALSLSHLSKDSLKGLRNEEKNLQLLAAQSLLLASKFIEKSRIFPAEIVYQVRGWGRDDFEMLKSGHIEEYILTVIDFDLIMLSPADFIEFFMGTWSQTIPKGNCELHGGDSKLNSLFRSEIEIKKLHLTARQICDLMVTNLGPKMSLVYLPSQVAAACLQMALRYF